MKRLLASLVRFLRRTFRSSKSNEEIEVEVARRETSELCVQAFAKDGLDHDPLAGHGGAALLEMGRQVECASIRVRVRRQAAENDSATHRYVVTRRDAGARLDRASDLEDRPRSDRDRGR